MARSAMSGLLMWVSLLLSGLDICVALAGGTKLAFASYYGSHMVLQQAPQRANVWGVGLLGNTVALTLSNGDMDKTYTTTVKSGNHPSIDGATGVWSIMLEAMPAGGPHTVTVRDTQTGETISMSDVKFGDVWVCSGQSNMQFSMNMVLNAQKEIATADNYPDIRLFDVSERFSKYPLTDLLSIDERWSVSSKETVSAPKTWSYFSAVCWLYGRYLYDQLKYPIGLVESVWGGTPVEAWSSPDALMKCNISSSPLKGNDVSCNKSVSCPSGTTCCQLADGNWGCCDFPEAVCCDDHVHCCPHGSTCDLAEAKCQFKDGRQLPLSEKRPANRESRVNISDEEKRLKWIKENYVMCNATTRCMSTETCCHTLDGTWECCQKPHSVCCANHIHCCPRGYRCDMKTDRCFAEELGYTPMLKRKPALVLKDNPHQMKTSDWLKESIVCNASQTCEPGQTCCKMSSGDWGCCPLPNAVCCSDHIHCCPRGTKCDVSAGACLSERGAVPALTKQPAQRTKSFQSPYQKMGSNWLKENIVCNDTQQTCGPDETCCKMPSGDWGCCPLPNAVCCSDHIHCCPRDTTCDVTAGMCLSEKGAVPALKKQPAQRRLSSISDRDYAADPTIYADGRSIGTQSDHSQLWNAMIHPLLNMTIYGAIWYQGEANAGSPNSYNCTFPAMIDDWRLKFHVGSGGQTSPTFPFGFVQLAANRDPKKVEAVTGFTDIRWHQTADFGYVPNPRLKDVFMAVAMDLPDYTSPFGSIHPRDKQDVAIRLGQAGMAVAYKKPGVKFQGPFPKSFEVNPLNVTVIYGNSNSMTVQNKDGFELCCTSSKQSYCADTDQGWTVAPIADTAGNHVTLMYSFACEGKKVSGIRYAWRESPCDFKKCSVYDSESQLPAAPFVFFNIVN